MVQTGQRRLRKLALPPVVHPIRQRAHSLAPGATVCGLLRQRTPQGPAGHVVRSMVAARDLPVAVHPQRTHLTLAGRASPGMRTGSGAPRGGAEMFGAGNLQAGTIRPAGFIPFGLAARGTFKGPGFLAVWICS